VRCDKGLEGIAVSPASRVEKLPLATACAFEVVVDAGKANAPFPI
jgi:hypothetical protein